MYMEVFSDCFHSLPNAVADDKEEEASASEVCGERIVEALFVDRRVRFEVSLTAADHVGLRVSSELLSVAVRVQGRSVQSGAYDAEVDRSPKFAGTSPATEYSK